MTEIADRPRVLSGIHRDYLRAFAITDEVISAAGVWSDGDIIMFPYRDGDLLVHQRRRWPEDEETAALGKKSQAKYLWEKGVPLHFNALRPVTGDGGPVLICEGTKQALCVTSWALPQYAIYGMAGCDGWVSASLSRFKGRRVIILLDADAGSNHEVYTAGEKLAAKLKALGAEPAFVPSPAWGKDGIDDFLAGIEPPDRAEVLTRLIGQAEIADRKGNLRPRDKPADRKPAYRPPAQAPDTGGRPMVVINADRRDVIQRTLFYLKQLWDGHYAFSYGGVLTRLRIGSDDEGNITTAVTEPLERGAFADWLSQAVYTCKHVPATMTTPERWEPAWPELITLEALLSTGEQFAPLDRISRTPFIRTDGSVCAKQGYDETSHTYLVTGNSGMDRLDVPEMPTRDQARQAAASLVHGWLGDRPEQGLSGIAFRDDVSRANALALVLTPFIRGLVPLVPVAVISGLQEGVGKGLLGDCVSLMLTGENMSPLPWSVLDDEENRKQITSAFREGASTLMWFDEAHEIESHALSRAVTSLTYADRILGVSKIARYPNQVTWLATGNQVQVSADMARRAYWIEIYPDDPDPQDRPEDKFTHPDLRTWTQENRPELTAAALTMIRAWFAAGRPDPEKPRTTAMGSFERWDKMMSGILAWAGVGGFLGNLASKRAERNVTGGYWSEHLAWLRSAFRDAEFTLTEVHKAARESGGSWEAPPRMDNLEVPGFTRLLGQAYAKVTDRWFGPYRIAKTGTGHGKVGKWAVRQSTETETPPDQDGRIPEETDKGKIAAKLVRRGEETEETLPQASPCARAGVPLRAHEQGARTVSPLSSGSAGLALGFDLETADAKLLFRGGHDGPFARLAGVIGPPGVPKLVAVDRLPGTLAMAASWYGHNILGFDGLALARQAEDPRVFWDWFCSGARDTELIARQVYPPKSRESGSSEDKRGLDAVAALLGIAGKTGDLAAIARRHGGYDKIPLDDAEYVSYLLDGDMPATRGVAQALLPYYDSDAYIRREHDLARIAGHMRLNGLLVDRGLLEQRYAAGEARKARAAQVLHDGWGLPLGRTVMRGRGKAKAEAFEEFTSPLATGEGRAWLAQMWQRYQVPAPPLTGTGKLAIGAEDLKRVAADPACPGDLRAMITAMNVVTTTRTVYQTAREWLCPDGRVHPGISFRQASGRWSVTDPGLTVFGKHGGRHAERDIFTAAPGCSLWSFDLSQVDMRAIAGHCQDPAYAAMFAPGRDAHDETAALVFGEAARDASGHHPMRQAAKAYGHGWNYGLGPKRMIENGNPPDQVYAYVNGMEARFPVLCQWREGIRSRARDGDILDNGFGRRMLAEPARAYTVAPALMGQGGARDILGDCMLRLDPALYEYLLLQVHDELIFELPDDEADEAVPAIRAAMEGEFRGVPILVDQAGPGHSWGSISAKG
jgi:DNA polymerase-1